jgi:hypothetical protein
MTQQTKTKLKQLPTRMRYQVGYGKPPSETRFKKGQSGNPRGRPRGSKNKLPALNEERLKTIVLQEAYRTIKVSDGDRQVTIPMAQAIIRSLAVLAAKGNQRAQRLFTQLVASVEGDNKRLHDEWLNTAIEYKVSWERELARRARQGVSGPEPIPHPDHIVIDMSSGQVRIKGPMTKEEKIVWDELRARKQECDKTIHELESLLKGNLNSKLKHFVEEDLEFERELRAKLCQLFPDEGSNS